MVSSQAGGSAGGGSAASFSTLLSSDGRNCEGYALRYPAVAKGGTKEDQRKRVLNRDAAVKVVDWMLKNPLRCVDVWGEVLNLRKEEIVQQQGTFPACVRRAVHTQWQASVMARRWGPESFSWEERDRWRSIGGPASLPLRLPRPVNEKAYFAMDIIISADGSFLQDGDKVYVLSVEPLHHRVLTIDYFHGFVFGGAAAVFLEDHRHNDRGHISRNMIGIARRAGGGEWRTGEWSQMKVGFVVQRIIHIQRRFRARLQARMSNRPLAVVGSDDSSASKRRRIVLLD